MIMDSKHLCNFLVLDIGGDYISVLYYICDKNGSKAFIQFILWIPRTSCIYLKDYCMCFTIRKEYIQRKSVV
jgi:hypothetical protein